MLKKNTHIEDSVGIGDVNSPNPQIQHNLTQITALLSCQADSKIYKET